MSDVSERYSNIYFVELAEYEGQKYNAVSYL